MKKAIMAISMAAFTLMGAFSSASQAADFSDDTTTVKKTHEERAYKEAYPSFAAPPSYYTKKVTTRTCIDDGDGITCHYQRFSSH